MTRISPPASVVLASPFLVVACTLSLLGRPLPGLTPATQPTSPATESAAPPTASKYPAATMPAATEPASATPSTTGVAFCENPQPLALIGQFESAILTRNGALLASLVSPEHGMDARLYRDGRVVNYDRQHASALFDSTFSLDWGNAPGSGLPTKGSFQELFLPDLLDVLTKDYEITCNQVRVGGTTYSALWPYGGIDFFSLHVPGTEEYGGMDWHTWLIGLHFVGGKPFLYAIMQFKWEI